MLKHFLCSLITSLCLHTPAAHAVGEFVQYEELEAVIAQLEQDKIYAPGELQTLFTQVARDERVLKLIAAPAESTREWKDYRPLFINKTRIKKGADFWLTYADALQRAEKTYGVPAEMIVAIIGVETTYGDNKGRNRVIDALATLGFDYPPRAPFFRKELREFLILCKENGMDAVNTWGSYAGAMGFPQFMPSSWRKLAVDFDGDGHIDLINSPIDAIGSVAHYFKENGWQTGEPVVTRARLISQDYDSIISRDLDTTSTLDSIAQKGIIPREPGSYLASTAASAIRLQGENGGEFWLGFKNFYVITRYNRSILYAMAAYQLSQELRQAYNASLAETLPSTPEGS